MIPILFEKTETSFTSNGLGRLSDCKRCIVTEERNGVYECEFDYPVNGVHFSDIQEGRIIACTHDEQGDVQPFDIYARTEPIDGVVTFYAHHISYRLNGIVVKPMEASSCAAALQALKTYSIGSNPFTFWTNKSTSGSYSIEEPRRLRGLLAGEEGSILDVYGTGEYRFDKFNVNLYLHRGQDTNVSIRYGKNLIDYKNDYDASEVYTAAVPYWLGDVTEEVGDESVTKTVLVMLPEGFISSGHTSPGGREVYTPMDLSDEFEEPPAVASLRSAAQSKLASSDGWLPSQTIKVDFVQLWQTEEYAEYAPLQRLCLCDTCGVFVPMYDVAVRAKVIRVVYNTLLDRYDEMELGDKPTTYAAVVGKIYSSKVAGVYAGLKTIAVDIQTAQQNAAVDATNKANNAKDQAISSAKSYTDSAIGSAKTTIEDEYEQAIADATELIRGGTGGYVVTTVNANGQPIELLITDNINLNQAVNVWRWNQGGLGHSHNGYNGPFSDVAITQDGKINASMITTGTLNADIIRAGTLQDVNGNTSFNLTTGAFTMKKGSINLGNGSFAVTDVGALTATSGEIAGFTIESSKLSASGSIMHGGSRRYYTHEISHYQNIIRWGTSEDVKNYYTAMDTEGIDIYNDRGTARFDRNGIDIYSGNDGFVVDPYSGTIIFEKPSAGNNFELNMSNSSKLDFTLGNWNVEMDNAYGLEVNLSGEAVLAIDSKKTRLAYDDSTFFKIDNNGYCFHDVTSGSGSAVYLTAGGYLRKSSSSVRWKENIRDLGKDVSGLYNLRPREFRYKKGVLSKDDEMYGQYVIGFIAEEVEKVLPEAVIHEKDGQCADWNVRVIVPAMLKLIQDQHADIEQIEAKLEEVTNGRKS